MDEDAIDVEALQAQIDLSMSFAQNLVSSWIQPHKHPRNLHKKDLEKELSEYMQRPARLGVGASIPESHNFATRETTRLKGKLAGTKRPRDFDDAIAPLQPSDIEGESRAITIKKRPKYDPFDVVHGKKKKREKDIDNEDPNPPIPVDPNVTKVQATISAQENANKCIDGPEPNSPTLPPSKKRKKRKKLTVEPENGAYDVEGCKAGASSALLFNGSSNVLNPASTPPHSAELDSMDANLKSELTVDVSLTSTPTLNIQPRHKPIPLELLKRPLLNLKPYSNHDSDHEGTPSSSPQKKRRRRRRKKKNSLIPSATDTKFDEAVTSNLK